MLDKQHTLFVCTTCASVWQDGRRVDESKGEQLLQQLQELAQAWELRNKFLIQGVECMSACNHSCVVAFTAEGKSTYLFGDLPVDGCASKFRFLCSRQPQLVLFPKRRKFANSGCATNGVN
ncbi:DUF1636 family protein [Nostoc sp.]|uniref:DUF1636 family protein n=1 Tax=Nostoc sp. TaxID=1180 RepID=UPI002FFCD39A